MATNNIIEPQIKELKQNSLDFHLRLEIAGADLIIEDMDIDVEYIKTTDSNPNKSTVTIWNVAEDTFKRLMKTTAMDIYCWYGDDEPAFLFRGYIAPQKIVKMNAVAGKINTARGFLASSVKQDNKGQFDIPTVIELVDSKLNYVAVKINKTYIQEVDTKILMNDCIEALGVGVGFISPNIPTKTYKTGYKLFGRPHVVLKTILDAVGAKFHITNGFIYVNMPSDKNNGTYAVVLDPSNSMQPDQQSENKVVISTRLIPFLNAGDWVKFNFKEIDSVERITEIRGKCNNYGTAGTSEIVVKIPIEKKKKKRKKAKKGT